MGLVQMLEAWKGKPVEQLLREEYVVARRSIHDIAKDWHVSSGTLHAWITRYGMERLGTSLSQNLCGLEMERIAQTKGEPNESD